jgi:hypothetical protein
MNGRVIRETILELLRFLACLVGGYAAFAIGMFCSGLFATPLNGGCGLPLIMPLFLGGIGGVLAYRQGIFNSELVPSVRLAVATLLIIVLPLAFIPLIRIVSTSVARWSDFEIVLRLVAGATIIGTINGAFGGIVGSLLWRKEAKGHNFDGVD